MLSFSTGLNLRLKRFEAGRVVDLAFVCTQHTNLVSIPQKSILFSQWCHEWTLSRFRSKPWELPGMAQKYNKINKQKDRENVQKSIKKKWWLKSNSIMWPNRIETWQLDFITMASMDREIRNWVSKKRVKILRKYGIEKQAYWREQ